MNVQDRDRTRVVFDGAADQDLVPEPEDEVEEGAQDGQYERHADAPDAPRPCLWPSPHGNYQARSPLPLVIPPPFVSGTPANEVDSNSYI